MLPLLRILPVGGVLLAIMLLVLALDPPDAPRLPPRPDAARGALIERRLHPEWQQFFIQAAMQRAEELKRLLELPDSPALAALPPQAGEPEPAPPKAAGLPAERKDADPDRDETDSIAPQPEASLPVDIGEASSFELPIGATEEKPPVIHAPASARPRKDSRIKRAPVRRAKIQAQPKPDSMDSFGDLFGMRATRRRHRPTPTFVSRAQ